MMQGIIVNIAVGVIVKLIERYLAKITPEQRGRILEKMKAQAQAGPDAEKDDFREANLP